jgi:hypothetical protein
MRDIGRKSPSVENCEVVLVQIFGKERNESVGVAKV